MGHDMHTLLHDDRLYSNNTSIYHKASIVRQYREDTLAREDAIALLKYQPAFAGKDILDIGVGTGRTAIYLAPLAHRYQAVDYSPVMVERFRRELPDVPIALADMRDLSQFEGSSFDFVLASNNVFDAVGHDDRLQVFREMHRLLRPNGTLMFSTHNQDVGDLWDGPRLYFDHNPVTLAMLVLHWGLAWTRHARLQRFQEVCDDHAIVNDEAHDCGLLHYYIGPEAQRRQLAKEGFELLEILDRYGAPVPPGQRAEHSRWLLYVARRVQVS